MKVLTGSHKRGQIALLPPKISLSALYKSPASPSLILPITRAIFKEREFYLASRLMEAKIKAEGLDPPTDKDNGPKSLLQSEALYQVLLSFYSLLIISMELNFP
jgi:hypothetical protein